MTKTTMTRAAQVLLAGATQYALASWLARVAERSFGQPSYPSVVIPFQRLAKETAPAPVPAARVG